jgi:hypothetical protein
MKLANLTESTKLTQKPERISPCVHGQVHEIGQDFDRDGKLLTLERCE